MNVPTDANEIEILKSQQTIRWQEMSYRRDYEEKTTRWSIVFMLGITGWLITNSAFLQYAYGKYCVVIFLAILAIGAGLLLIKNYESYTRNLNILNRVDEQLGLIADDENSIIWSKEKSPNPPIWGVRGRGIFIFLTWLACSFLLLTISPDSPTAQENKKSEIVSPKQDSTQTKNSPAISQNDPNSLLDLSTLLNVGATLCAAFFGAWFAYKLQNRTQKQKQEEENIAAGNIALFSLLRQRNQLVIIKEQIIDPYRDDPARMINMRPMPPINPAEYRINYDQLNFLLSTKHKGLLMELFSQEKMFENAIETVNDRSKLHRDEIQPRLDGRISEETEELEQTVHQILGDRLFLTLQRLTDESVRRIDREPEEIAKFAKKFRDALKQVFPKADFL